VNASENEVYDQTSGRNWLSIYIANVQGTATTYNKNIRIYTTITYEDGTESDPVFQGFLYSTANQVDFHFAYGICFALMNKNVKAINLYASTANDTVYTAGWADESSGYYLLSSLQVQTMTSEESALSSWKQQNLAYKQKSYFGFFTSSSYYHASSLEIQNAIDGGAITLNTALNHAVDKNRSYPTPIHITKGTRDQGSIIVINEGDTKLHTSLYDGYGNHQDSNFPNVALDNNGNKLLIEMLGSSELLGLEILYDTIFAFRNNLIETYDLQGVPKRTYLADIASRKSIVATPYGIVYAGKSAIFIVPSDGSEIQVLNEGYESYYGGDDYVTGSTQYITDAYRAAIIGGYDETYKEVWMLIQVNTATSSEYINFRYSFGLKKWVERRLNTSDTIKYFTKRQIDGTFTIGLTKGLLKYPNRIGSYQWQDDVRINGASTEISQSKAIPFAFTLNIARFNNQIRENVLHGFVLDFTGSSSNNGGLAIVEFYANDEEEPFDTHYVRVDERMDYRMIKRRGNIQRLSIAVSLPDDSTFEKFDLSKITLGFVSGTKLGNL